MSLPARGCGGGMPFPTLQLVGLFPAADQRGVSPTLRVQPGKYPEMNEYKSHEQN